MLGQQNNTNQQQQTKYKQYWEGEATREGDKRTYLEEDQPNKKKLQRERKQPPTRSRSRRTKQRSEDEGDQQGEDHLRKGENRKGEVEVQRRKQKRRRNSTAGGVNKWLIRMSNCSFIYIKWVKDIFTYKVLNVPTKMLGVQSKTLKQPNPM